MKPANHLRRRLLQSLSAVPWLTACQSNAIERTASPESLAQRRRFKGIALRLVVDAVPGAEMEGVEFFADERVRPVYHSSSVSQRVRSMYDFGGPIPLKVRVVWRKERIGAQLSWGNMGSYDDFGRYLGRPGVYIEPLTDEAKQIAKRQIVSENTGVPHYGPWGSDYRGELAGDFTAEVASRISDEVLRDIRKYGGGIRLKFRLKPDGVLFGWDIERGEDLAYRFSHAGGDFREAGIAYELPGYSDPNSAGWKKALNDEGFLVPASPRAKFIWRKGWEIKPDGSRVLSEY